MNTAMHDVDLLCAIVILRFFEQLNVPTESGADQEQHLAGKLPCDQAKKTLVFWV